MPSPSPACTACLIASLLLISMLVWISSPWAAKKRSIAPRVPEPASRTRKDSVASCVDGHFLLAGQRMVGRGDDHQRVVHEAGGFQVQVFGHLAHDGQIDAVGGQLVQHRRAVGHVQMNRHPGMPAAKAGQDVGGDGVHGRGHGKVEAAAVHAAQLRQIGLQVVQPRGDGSGWRAAPRARPR